MQHSTNVANDIEFLWFDKAVNIKINQYLMKNFAMPGFLFFHLFESDYKLYSHDKVATTFDMILNNLSFFKYF